MANEPIWRHALYEPAMQRPEREQPIVTAAAAASSELLTGVLHAFVAFDWGDEVDLDAASKLVPAELLELARRRRTPSSIGYTPAPLRFHLPAIEVDLPEIGRVRAPAEATLFDFAAASIAVHVPFQLDAGALGQLAGWLAQPEPLVQEIQRAIEPLHGKLIPAIRQPLWSASSEEYFVFQLPTGGPLPAPETLLVERGSWLAGLLRLESSPLSSEEVSEALRLRIGYTPQDLAVFEWGAMVLVDDDCDETLQVVQFANVQLLEFRYIEQRLDQRLDAAYDLIHPLAHSWLPFWNLYGRPLRALGELKMEANGLFARASSGLKLVGDQYLARVYRMLSTRFHLDQWEHDIRESLDLVQEVYQVVSDQAATYRTEMLEVIVIVLILIEIVMAFVGR